MRREGRVVNDKLPPTQRALPGIPLTPDVQIELWIAEHIGNPDLFSGVTTLEQRRERIRLALLPISDHIAGKGKSGSTRDLVDFVQAHLWSLTRSGDAAWSNLTCSRLEQPAGVARA